MSPTEKSFWYRVGYALERARKLPSTSPRRLSGLKVRRPTRKRDATPRRSGLTTDELVASGAVALAAKLLDAWRPRKRSGLVSLLRSGAAGAAAALLLELLRPLVDGEEARPALDEATADRLLAGAGQGLVYGAVVEPWIPGPPALKGAVYGSTEFMLDPLGGLSRLLGTRTPLRRVPVLMHFLEGLDPHDRSYLEHVVYGVTLALLYGSSPSSNGILPDEV